MKTTFQVLARNPDNGYKPEPMTVKGYRFGVYGAHKALHGAEGYSLVHIPSGFLIGCTRLLREAKAAAEWLHKNHPDVGAHWAFDNVPQNELAELAQSQWRRDIDRAIFIAEGGRSV